MELASQKLKELCQKFIEREYGLEEFQSRLETAIFPERIEEAKHHLLNELEEIRFTKLNSNYYQFGLEIVKRILNCLED